MNIRNRFRRQRSKGLIEIITVMALPSLLLLAGLAIDVGRAYIVKGKLYAAIDAAGIAAARAIENGPDAANAAAQKFFYANIPNDYMGTSPTIILPASYPTDSAGNITIDISGTANMPTTLITILGIDTIPVGAVTQATRRPVDLAFIIDNSSSLTSGSLGNVTQDVEDRSKDFIARFHEGLDRVSLIKYGHGAENPVPFPTDGSRGFSYSAMESAIDAMSFNGFTNPSEGFYLALEQLRNVPNPADLQVIVFFTDGAPNTFSSQFILNDGTFTGSLRASSSSSGTPRGLYQHDDVYDTLPSGAGWESYNIDDELTELPVYYNAHADDYVPQYATDPTSDPGYPGPNSDNFLIVNSTTTDGAYDSGLGFRPVTQYDPGEDSANDLFRKTSRISRNLAEDMAEHARTEGIYVFTLGLGSRLIDTSGPDSEYGDDMLKRMANDPIMLDDSFLQPDYKDDQLKGVYCYAEDEDALEPCFGEMLEVIIKLTM